MRRVTILLTATLMAAPATAMAQTCRGDAAKPIPVTGLAGSLQNPCPSPDGTALAFTNFKRRYNTGGSVVWTVPAAGGAPTRALSPRSGAQSVNLPGQCWSAAGNVVYSSDVVDRDEIYIVPAAGGTAKRLTDRPGLLAWEPSISPVLADRSQWIVFESHREADPEGPAELWKMRVDGSGLVRLTQGADDRQPQWSPRGDRIAFQRQIKPDQWDVMTIDTAGGGLLDVTRAPARSNTDPSWSPSGAWLVYSGGGPDLDNANLFVISAMGGTPVRLTVNCGYDGAPGWSADGRSIVFESAPYDPDVRGSTTLWRIAAPAGMR
ncbi:TolB family protein [Inquilinus sp. NPDC058860]|uniref:TolB family protein n=1 Tax=Inquilinus sp. NPDC058860 TaxID=3346652 RepID=UPI0036C46DCA